MEKIKIRKFHFIGIVFFSTYNGLVTKEEKVETAPAVTDEPKKRSALKVTLSILALLVVICAIALLLFIMLAHIAPDFVDSLLYTPEELKIINY